MKPIDSNLAPNSEDKKGTFFKISFFKRFDRIQPGLPVCRFWCLFDQTRTNDPSPYVLILLRNRFKGNKIRACCGFYDHISHIGKLYVDFEEPISLTCLTSLNIEMMVSSLYKEQPIFKETPLHSYIITSITFRSEEYWEMRKIVDCKRLGPDFKYFTLIDQPYFS